jgi:hypothetical protein
MAPNGGRQRSKRKRKPSESFDDPSSDDARHKRGQGADAGGSAEQEERGERNCENRVLCEIYLILLTKSGTGDGWIAAGIKPAAIIRPRLAHGDVARGLGFRV